MEEELKTPPRTLPPSTPPPSTPEPYEPSTPDLFRYTTPEPYEPRTPEPSLSYKRRSNNNNSSPGKRVRGYGVLEHSDEAIGIFKNKLRRVSKLYDDMYLVGSAALFAYCLSINEGYEHSLEMPNDFDIVIPHNPMGIKVKYMNTNGFILAKKYKRMYRGFLAIYDGVKFISEDGSISIDLIVAKGLKHIPVKPRKIIVDDRMGDIKINISPLSDLYYQYSQLERETNHPKFDVLESLKDNKPNEFSNNSNNSNNSSSSQFRSSRFGSPPSSSPLAQRLFGGKRKTRKTKISVKSSKSKRTMKRTTRKNKKSKH